MSVEIHLTDNVPFYTNLDKISGRVILTLLADESVSSIQVKLEGESTTRLLGPESQRLVTRPHEGRVGPNVQAELHKVNAFKSEGRKDGRFPGG